MSEISDLANKHYDRLRSEYAEKFPDDTNIQNSAYLFALIQSQYIVDVMTNNEALGVDYHGALLHMLSSFTKQSIDAFRKSENLPAVDWENGASLVKEV